MRAIFIPSLRSTRGFTLVELVISIVIIAMAATALMGTLSFIATQSGEAAAREQANAIATAYLNVAASQTFAALPAYAAAHANDVGALDQLGNAIAGLNRYTISVSATPTTALPLIPSTAALRIDVTVTHPSGVQVIFTGYRTNHT
jgi:MSHA pilin protein MshD